MSSENPTRGVPDTRHPPAAPVPHKAAALLLGCARVDPILREAAEQVQDALIALERERDALRALASASPSGYTEKPCARCSSRGAPVCCCVDGAVPDTGHRTDAVAKAAKDALGTWDAMGYLGLTEMSDAMERLRDVLASASPSGDTGQEARDGE